MTSQAPQSGSQNLADGFHDAGNLKRAEGAQ
jgi:hypothetical protein